jgi:membrane protein
MRRLRFIAGLFVKSATGWIDDRCDRMAAALSYYALFSLFPLALLSVTALGFILCGDPAIRERLIGSYDFTGSPELRDLLDDTLAGMQHHQTARGVGLAVGVVSLLFGASGVFSELQSALDRIWRAPPAPSTGPLATILNLVQGKAVALLLVLSAAGVLLASLVASTALAAVGQTGQQVLPSAPLWQLVEIVGSAGFLALVLAVLFRTLPRVRVRWRDALLGATVAGILMSAAKRVLAYYLAHMGSYAAYGVVGSVLGLLLWTYVTSMLLFFGAELARASESSKSVDPKALGGTAAARPRVPQPLV